MFALECEFKYQHRYCAAMLDIITHKPKDLESRQTIGVDRDNLFINIFSTVRCLFS